jgi:hypothetical protein
VAVDQCRAANRSEEGSQKCRLSESQRNDLWPERLADISRVEAPLGGPRPHRPLAREEVDCGAAYDLRHGQSESPAGPGSSARAPAESEFQYAGAQPDPAKRLDILGTFR